jgi:hypothetical protein
VLLPVTFLDEQFIWFTLATVHLGIITMDVAALILVALLSLMLIVKNDAYFIHIDAHAEECFFDKVTSGTKMSLMFEVAEGGFLDIDVKVQTRII